MASEPLLPKAGSGSDPHDAAFFDDVAWLQRLVEHCLWTARGPARGSLPIHVAAQGNAVRAMAYLLSLPAAKEHGVDALDTEQATPLRYAVRSRSHEAVVWLVKRGAGIAPSSTLGGTLVQEAAQSGSTTMVALLANLGADVSSMDPVSSTSKTPLEIAVEQRNLEMTEHLVLMTQCGTAIRQKVLEQTSGPRDLWIRRCLAGGVGSHERDAAQPSCRDPTRCGSCCCCGFPLLARRCAGPDIVRVEHVHASIASGLGSLVVAGATLAGLPCLGTASDLAGVRDAARLLLLFTSATFVCYFATVRTAAGVVARDANHADVYEAALRSVAAVTAESPAWRASWWGVPGPVVHQLRVVGPARSKFCTGQRQIVPEYDHYCTFTRSPIGRDNYMYFMATIIFAALTCIWTCGIAVALFPFDWSVCFFVVLILYYVLAAATFVALVFSNLYHAKLGVTTWEMEQLRRGKPPAYFVPYNGVFVSPRFNRGFIRNLLIRLFPSCDRQSADEVSVPSNHNKSLQIKTSRHHVRTNHDVVLDVDTHYMEDVE